jgi:catechol 2,3-dioxygenase-like lactoylglutathione lyase family enzyme
MRQKLNLITLGVNDFERAVNFYEKGLGWKKSPASVGDLAVFPLGGIVLALYPRKLLAEDALVNDNGSGFPGITLSYNTKRENEVNDVLKEVEKLGAQLQSLLKKCFGEVTPGTLKI